MIYESNTVRWKVGDLVIHDCDQKHARMLMRVVGYARDGCCKTRYVERGGHTLKGEIANDLKFLHDPARFGIATEQGGDGEAAL